MRKAHLMLAAILAASVLAAGCGGGGDNDKQSFGADVGSTATLSKAEFLAQGNAICDAGNKEIDAAAPNGPDQAKLTAFVTDTLVPSVQGQIDDLRALGAPAGDEQELNSIYADAEAELGALKADPASISSSTFSDVNTRLNAYGLTSCGGGADDSGGTTTGSDDTGTTTDSATTTGSDDGTGAKRDGGGTYAPGTDSNGDGIPDPSQ